MKAKTSDWAQALQHLMEEKGWTQSDAARALGTTQSTISRTIKGSKPRNPLRERLMKRAQVISREIPLAAIAVTIAESRELEELVKLIALEVHKRRRIGK